MTFNLEMKANTWPLQTIEKFCFFPSNKQSTNTSPDNAEKRKGNATAYRNYLNRDGPRALGSKEIPQVTQNPSRNSSTRYGFTERVLFRVRRTVWRAACLCWLASLSLWSGTRPSPSSSATGARWRGTSVGRPPTWFRVETAESRNSRRWRKVQNAGTNVHLHKKWNEGMTILCNCLYTGGEFGHQDCGWGRSVGADQNKTRKKVEVWNRCRGWGWCF